MDSNSRSRRVDTGHLLVERLRGADGGRRGHLPVADGGRRVAHLPVADGGLQAAHLPVAVDLRVVDLRVVVLLAGVLRVVVLRAGPRVEDRRAAGAPPVVRRQGDGGLREGLRRAVGDRRAALRRAVGGRREDRRAALRRVDGARREGTVPHRVATADPPGLGTPAGILLPAAGIPALPLKRVARATLSRPAMR